MTDFLFTNRCLASLPSKGRGVFRDQWDREKTSIFAVAAAHRRIHLYQVSESLTPEADSRIGIYLIHHGKQLLGEFAMSTPVPLRS
ncbi:MAG: hypothetical protein WA624_12295, partial [Methylocella sp.]